MGTTRRRAWQRAQGYLWQVALHGIIVLGLIFATGATNPVAAQEMECDTDPPVIVTATDGNDLDINIFFTAKLRLPDGRLISYDQMMKHLHDNVRLTLLEAERNDEFYNIVIRANVFTIDGQSFPVKGRMIHPDTSTHSAIFPGVTGQDFTMTMTIPATKKFKERKNHHKIQLVVVDGAGKKKQPKGGKAGS